MATPAHTSPVAVWGLGYIGLTTTHALLEQGVEVVGIDVDGGRLAAIASDRVVLHRSIPSLHLDLRGYVASGQLRLAQGRAAADLLPDRHLICVPTERDGVPSDDALRSVVAKTRAHAEPECIVIESTIAPTWLDREYLSGLRFCLAPRRDWFHSDKHSLRALTRVIAATDRETEQSALGLLRLVSESIVTSEDLHAVAFTKPFENSLWLLMASYTNYLADAIPATDFHEVLRLARTNWRTPFELYPTYRVGGYCLPLSIEYIAQAHPGGNFPYAEAVRDLNDRPARALVADIVATGATRPLVLGICYRPETRVHTNSGGLAVSCALVQANVDCRVHDPFYSAEELHALTGATPVPFPAGIRDADAVVLSVGHPDYVGFDISAYVSALSSPHLTVYDATNSWRALAGVEGVAYHSPGAPRFHMTESDGR